MKRLIFLVIILSGQMWAAYTVRPGFDVRATENLFLASMDNDLAKAERAIAAGADARAVDNYGATPLHWAALRNARRVVALLIEKGANVKAANNNGDTPLHWAALYNAKDDVVKLLIEKGADVKAVNNYGATPLYMAAVQNAEDAAKVLLEHGVEIPYGLSDSSIEFLDSVIKEINEERLALEARAVAALFGAEVSKRNVSIPFMLESLLDNRLPLASEVEAQRKSAAKQLQKVGKGMKARKELNELR